MTFLGVGFEEELELELLEELLAFAFALLARASAALFFLSLARRAAASLFALIRAASFLEVELDFFTCGLVTF